MFLYRFQQFMNLHRGNCFVGLPGFNSLCKGCRKNGMKPTFRSRTRIAPRSAHSQQDLQQKNKMALPTKRRWKEPMRGSEISTHQQCPLRPANLVALILYTGSATGVDVIDGPSEPRVNRKGSSSNEEGGLGKKLLAHSLRLFSVGDSDRYTRSV